MKNKFRFSMMIAIDIMIVIMIVVLSANHPSKKVFSVDKVWQCSDDQDNTWELSETHLGADTVLEITVENHLDCELR